MPLVYQQNINAHTRSGVWHIEETEAFFLQQVMLQNDITHPHKRLQHLAGRYLLKELFNDFPLELIQIATTRKPFLADEAFHFSISHCGDYAAAIVSTVNRVGIDIEIPHPKIERIKNKFLNEAELQLLITTGMNMERALTGAWSIKEAMFKWYGEGLVDFRDHMHIDQITFNANEFTADCLFKKGKVVPLKLHGLFFNDNSLAWLVT